MKKREGINEAQKRDWLDPFAAEAMSVAGQLSGKYIRDEYV